MMVLALAAAGAAKLIIVTPDQPATATDFSSMQGCQRAADELKAQQQRAVDAWETDNAVILGAHPRWLDPNNKCLGTIPNSPRPTVAQVYCVPA